MITAGSHGSPSGRQSKLLARPHMCKDVAFPERPPIPSVAASRDLSDVQEVSGVSINMDELCIRVLGVGCPLLCETPTRLHFGLDIKSHRC